MLLYGEGKTMDFSETIVVYDLKLATDDWSDKKFLLTSKFCPLGAVSNFFETWNKWVKWSGLSVDITILSLGGCLLLPRGYMHVLTSGCIMCTGIRLLLLIYPFISSYFFVSNFQTLNFFVTLFSGTVRPRRLKLCTHMDSRWIYSVYRNQTTAAYFSLHFSFSPVFKH